MITKKIREIAIKRTVFLPLAVVFSLMLVVPTHAQLGSQSFANINFQDNAVTKAEIEVAQTSFSNPGILPGHPLYFLKRAGERVQLFLAFNNEEKSMLHLKFAKNRLAEAKKLTEENKTGVKEAVEEFDKEINETMGSTQSITKESDDIVKKSNIVLRFLLEKAPDRAKSSIENALNRSIEKGVKIRAEIERKTPSEIRQEIKQETEINEKIRQNIREEIRGIKEQVKTSTDPNIAIKTDMNVEVEAGNKESGSTEAASIQQTTQLPSTTSILP